MINKVKLKVDSDFVDYYDSLLSTDAVVVYKRKYGDALSKGKAIALLQRLGLQTALLGPVREIAPLSERLVVYIDPRKHRGEGKILMGSYDALLTYPNSLASPYYEGNNNITRKFLQIGSRRFRLVLKNESTFKLGEIIDFVEIQPSYNFDLRIPIFSIDYVDTRYGMVAIDFNNIECLKDLGLDRFIEPDNILYEVYTSIIKYGLI